MKNEISVVIICKNEVHIIERLLKSVQDITDDIVVYDNGSTDGTIELVNRYNVNLVQGEWLGFGATKHKAVTLAKHNWILSLDADESIDEELSSELKNLPLQKPNVVYDIPFKNFIGEKHLKRGEWGGDHHIRFFNRTYTNWNDANIHEDLVYPPDVTIEKLKGHVLHYTMKDMADYSTKIVQYALLNATKYFENGKRSSWVKRWLSPSFSFFNHYLVKLGFLDGWEGYAAARMTAFYTFLKYTRLHELWEQKDSIN